LPGDVLPPRKHTKDKVEQDEPTPLHEGAD
jgi:hypothetical protein